MKQFIKQYIRLPFFYVTIILFIILAHLTQQSLEYSNDVYETIISMSKSNIYAGNNHFLIYMLLILLNITTQIDLNNIVKIVRYESKEDYYKKNVIVNSFTYLFMFIILLILFVYGLLIINDAFIFEISLIFHTMIGIMSLVLFYGIFISMLLLFINMNINRYISLVIVFLISVFCVNSNNVLTASLGLLISNLNINVEVNWVIIIFYLSLNILLIQLNVFLYDRRDIE